MSLGISDHRQVFSDHFTDRRRLDRASSLGTNSALFVDIRGAALVDRVRTQIPHRCVQVLAHIRQRDQCCGILCGIDVPDRFGPNTGGVDVDHTNIDAVDIGRQNVVPQDNSLTYTPDAAAMEATWASTGRAMASGRLGAPMGFTNDERQRAGGAP